MSFWGFSKMGGVTNVKSLKRSSIPVLDWILLSTGFGGVLFSTVDEASAAASWRSKVIDMELNYAFHRSN